MDAFESELEDRFGTLPEDAHDLLSLARVRLLARTARIERIDAGPTAIALTPRRDMAASLKGLEKKDGRLLLREAISDARLRLDRVTTLLEDLIPED